MDTPNDHEDEPSVWTWDFDEDNRLDYDPDYFDDEYDDEILDPEISAANWCECGLPREVCHCDDWDENNPQMGPKIIGRE